MKKKKLKTMRNEILNTSVNTEILNYQPQIRWIHINEGSIYAAERIKSDIFMIGGSVWRRREIPHTQDLARSAPGEVVTMTEHLHQKELQKVGGMTFPSMVNVVIPLGDNIFIGCKHEKQTFNLITPNLEPVKSSDDDTGHGVYNAFYDADERQLVVATRKGKILKLSPDSLDIQTIIDVAQGGVRLWSLRKMESSGRLIAGDYQGFVYIIEGNIVVERRGFNNLAYDQISPERKNYQPSVFGLSALPKDKFVIGTRRGQLIWSSGSNLKVERHTVLPWEITYLETIPGSEDLLIGTREGVLILLIDQGESIALKPIYQIKPSVQHDNSIWSISFFTDHSCLVCFADGQVVCLDI